MCDGRSVPSSTTPRSFRSNHHIAADISMSAENTQIAPMLFVARWPATAEGKAAGDRDLPPAHRRRRAGDDRHYLARIGTARVATIATAPRQSRMREARAYSASETKRRTFSRPARPIANPVSEQPTEPWLCPARLQKPPNPLRLSSTRKNPASGHDGARQKRTKPLFPVALIRFSSGAVERI